MLWSSVNILLTFLNGSLVQKESTIDVYLYIFLNLNLLAVMESFQAKQATILMTTFTKKRCWIFSRAMSHICANDKPTGKHRYSLR
jgi:hypothetical protein